MNDNIKKVAITVVSSIIAAFTLLLIFTYFSGKAQDPKSLAPLCGNTVFYINAALIGILSAIICRDKACGFWSIGIYYALIFLISAFYQGFESFMGIAVKSGIGITVSVICFLFIASKLRGKGHRRRRRR